MLKIATNWLQYVDIHYVTYKIIRVVVQETQLSPVDIVGMAIITPRVTEFTCCGGGDHIHWGSKLRLSNPASSNPTEDATSRYQQPCVARFPMNYTTPKSLDFGNFDYLKRQNKTDKGMPKDELFKFIITVVDYKWKSGNIFFSIDIMNMHNILAKLRRHAIFKILTNWRQWVHIFTYCT